MDDKHREELEKVSDWNAQGIIIEDFVSEY
jgi:hypothetical protein